MKLCCPICKSELYKENSSFSCIHNHHFDLSKSGYLNLFISNNSKIHGDNKEMVQARTFFLEKEYYASLKEMINKQIGKIAPSSLLDLACGEGYYTKDFPCENKIGLDLSKDAVLYASKHDKITQYCVASIFDCPIESSSMDCITTLFAPIAESEINRCLKQGGHFFCVFPAENHLYELKETIYNNPYKNDRPTSLSTLSFVDEIRITQSIHLDNNKDIESLFMMTPYYYKTSLNDKEKINHLNSLDVTIDFYLLHYKKD